jgi:hypothetical protein
LSKFLLVEQGNKLKERGKAAAGGEMRALDE